MASTVTYTGKVGPGNSLTSKLFADVRQFALDFDKRTLSLNYYDPSSVQPQFVVLDMDGGTITLTDTVTNRQHVIAISVS